ncbi:carbonic anhydrase [bacterium endosymbiont of Bathymodiolus sp. 5 South]|uniref:carbonic anhydrase n=1 Tax=bacterium endosymbiont of Bathymodiolus sp. 5 South TaxID=1181670 RepID=UPI0010B4199B|nr:carbonic anhydrase [bacterium endosymbiont of Bathymodiolus sp. 5 South]CAC9460277.1 Carbonic anhydrase, beta class (EC 4.2.1.1) [uncultured Gammaproteobacteria bacterium]CAC9634468.1 Carbonic anhydrase, beta class (EC 4.2.1.1) [uncultured Gammaproteobacteria bacterium]CAC9648729.1 Carbonic anhydrase, beta class (EC 4.2.1.1) [uncultured Gammaproteobacteria bacterium]SHN91815.1 Carbonic anhydrase [bacterium endosymbiont of Bathymodiolus sp. 5 South]SSC08538.1 Carbonic anhydrase [bacterium en
MVDGNQRFIDGTTLHYKFYPHGDTKDIQDQEPFAIVLGCSDSRVPIETIFDQSFGDLFIIRIAGNIVAPSQMGSIEFAISKFKTSLVVVLGHSNCGAISATIDECINKTHLSNSLYSITDRIKPSILPLIDSGLSNHELTHKAVETNIINSVKQLQSQSPIIKRAIKNNKLEVIGANYSLKSGAVDFLT